MMSRYKPRGWRYESYRHSLARKGIRTASSRAGLVARAHGVPIYAKSLPVGQVYPVSPQEVKVRIEAMPKEDVKGLKAIEFTPPRDKQQEQAWGQLIRSRKKILLFSQPVDECGNMDGEDPERVRKIIKNYVIPHEVGHGIALNQRHITDKDLAMAEARADAHVVGMDVDDKDAKIFKSAHIS